MSKKNLIYLVIGGGVVIIKPINRDHHAYQVGQFMEYTGVSTEGEEIQNGGLALGLLKGLSTIPPVLPQRQY